MERSSESIISVCVSMHAIVSIWIYRIKVTHAIWSGLAKFMTELQSKRTTRLINMIECRRLRTICCAHNYTKFSISCFLSFQHKRIPINVSTRIGSNIFDVQSSNICTAIFIRSHLNGTRWFWFWLYKPPIWLNLCNICIWRKVLFVQCCFDDDNDESQYFRVNYCNETGHQHSNNNYHFKCKSALYDICIWLRPCNALQTVFRSLSLPLAGAKYFADSKNGLARSSISIRMGNFLRRSFQMCVVGR